MLDSPQLNTERLNLTKLRQGDLEAMFRYASNPKVARYTAWEPPKDITETKTVLEHILSEKYKKHCWGIRFISQPKLIGGIDFGISDTDTGEIHYVLDEPHWNQGIMTEAATCVINWAFSIIPELKLITSYAIEENVGSWRVLEKSGMSYTGNDFVKWKKFNYNPMQIKRYAINRNNNPNFQ